MEKKDRYQTDVSKDAVSRLYIYRSKSEVKLTHYCHTDSKGEGKLAPLCSPGKDPWYPLDRRLGGPKSWSGHRG
jgi:hypothetical protein